LVRAGLAISNEPPAMRMGSAAVPMIARSLTSPKPVRAGANGVTPAVAASNAASLVRAVPPLTVLKEPPA
jgi:hypothetical protein